MQHIKKVNGLVCAVKWQAIQSPFRYCFGLGLDEFSISLTSILPARTKLEVYQKKKLITFREK
jgi:phosphoenolpyruvate-protein kinase (PTS system EI component)